MIHHVVIRNYRGIELLDEEVPPGGILVTGENGTGKTSVLNALRAAFEARDVKPDAIREGADRCEILVDMDLVDVGDVQVRRAITEKGTQLTVRSPDGVETPKPQTWLAQIVGASIDPLKLLAASKKERRTMILSAIPCAVTEEAIRRRWAPDLPEGTDCSGHGLDVVLRVRDWYYDKRKLQNAAAKKAHAEALRLRDIAEKMAATDSAPPVADVEAALRARTEEYQALQTRDAQAAEAIERSNGTRRKIAEHRSTAEAAYVDPEEIERAREAWTDAGDRVAELRRQLEEADREYEECDARLTALNAKRSRHDSAIAQAADLEAALAHAVPARVDTEAMDIARNKVEIAKGNLAVASEYAAKQRAIAEARAAESLARNEKAEADRLDRIVQALADDAPKALMAAANGIPGVTVSGDDVLLEGTSIDGLCGAERLGLCIEVAKRANAKGKVLVVDGLEALDPTQHEAFVRHATAGGWQLFATRVTDGDLLVQAISGAVVAS